MSVCEFTQGYFKVTIQVMAELLTALVEALNVILIVFTDLLSALFKPLALFIQRLSEVLLESANELSMFHSTFISLPVSLPDLFVTSSNSFVGTSANRVIVVTVGVQLVLSDIGALFAELLKVLGLIRVHN